MQRQQSLIIREVFECKKISKTLPIKCCLWIGETKINIKPMTTLFDDLKENGYSDHEICEIMQVYYNCLDCSMT